MCGPENSAEAGGSMAGSRSSVMVLRRLVRQNLWKRGGDSLIDNAKMVPFISLKSSNLTTLTPNLPGIPPRIPFLRTIPQRHYKSPQEIPQRLRVSFGITTFRILRWLPSRADGKDFPEGPGEGALDVGYDCAWPE